MKECINIYTKLIINIIIIHFLIITIIIYTIKYKDFESLDKVEKSSYVLGSELWESKFDGLLSLVKEYIIDVWEI